MSVNIKYKNNSIATLTDTGTKTLKTSGKYCEADIIVENTKDGGGGGGIEVPTGYKVSTGSYTPSTEGTGVLHTIKIASSLPYNLPCRMFCIYREDGFDASGSDAGRYLTFYAGAIGNSIESSAGSCIYRRNNTAGNFEGNGGVDTINSFKYGLPPTNSTIRDNCFVRSIADNGNLTFSTYGIITLESGKTYKWFALLPSNAEV